MQKSLVLMVGKHARTGERVERRLQALGCPTRGVLRPTSPAFDWQDPSTWRAALREIETACGSKPERRQLIDTDHQAPLCGEPI